jgi:hypothetical protein
MRMQHLFFIKFIMGTLRVTAFEKSTNVGCYTATSGGNVHRRSIFGACILISAQHSTAQRGTEQNMEEGLIMMCEKHGLDRVMLGQVRSMYKQC